MFVELNLVVIKGIRNLQPGQSCGGIYNRNMYGVLRSATIYGTIQWYVQM